ncbi:hypothetical protein [Bartonella raoultii]|uniref:hypothetical protein n=1 Tax=Bartonella raoultii TaxID=1457020 RepID=UPI001ABBD00F|nr:hypothetical protein [Bartonella raoultii]
MADALDVVAALGVVDVGCFGAGACSDCRGGEACVASSTELLCLWEVGVWRLAGFGWWMWSVLARGHAL